MGTSTNQRSPARPTWRLPQALLGRPDVSPDIQGAEIWRAASFDPETAVARRLSDPILANACAIAAKAVSPVEATRLYDSVLNETRTAGFIFDLARRALTRSVAKGSGVQGFAAELFAETVAYYASRDLPSYVGKYGRISTASEVIEFKKKLQQHTRDVVSREPLPKLSKDNWSTFVYHIVDKLCAKATHG